MLTRRLMSGLLLAAGLALGCDAAEKPEPPAPEKPKEAAKAEGKRAALNEAKTLFLETFPDGRRRVLLEAEVCQRDVPLELFLCKKNTKEHEAILHVDADARDIHTALLAAKAEPGSPVQYQPKQKPPTGTTIKITVQYKNAKGETVTADAKEWVRNAKTRKALDVDWVFAGSQFFQDPDDPKKKPYYMANSGDVICVSNFGDAMLDLPIDSSKDNADLLFEAWTERIPERGTKVTVLLEPALKK
jgi:hypothetical protein